MSDHHDPVDEPAPSGLHPHDRRRVDAIEKDYLERAARNRRAIARLARNTYRLLGALVVVCAVAGALGLIAEHDASRSADAAARLARQVGRIARQAKAAARQEAANRHASLLQTCLTDDRRHDRTVAGLRRQYRQELQHPVLPGLDRRALAASLKSSIHLIDDLAPRTKDCRALADRRAPVPP